MATQMLYVIHKGESSNTLYASYFNGSTWTGNSIIAYLPGVIDPKSNETPALAAYNGRL